MSKELRMCVSAEGSTNKVEEPGTEPQLAPARVVEGTPVKSESTATKTDEAVPDPAAPVTEVSPVLAQDSPAITPENATATSETPPATGVSKDLPVETKEAIPPGGFPFKTKTAL